MSERMERLRVKARYDGARIGIISTWDVENNAVRVLAAELLAGAALQPGGWDPAETDPLLAPERFAPRMRP